MIIIIINITLFYSASIVNAFDFHLTLNKLILQRSYIQMQSRFNKIIRSFIYMSLHIYLQKL